MERPYKSGVWNDMSAQITIQPTNDGRAVWRIVSDPEIFGRVVDDAWITQAAENLESIVRGMVDNENNRTFLVLADGVHVGCFICFWQGSNLYEVHTFLTKLCRGGDAIRAGKMAMAHMFSMSCVERLISYCPACIPEAYWFARRCGWKATNAECPPWVKFGVSHSQQMVEARKEEWLAVHAEPVVPTMGQIEAVGHYCATLPQVECPLVHTFAPGVYCREITMPGATKEHSHGTFIIGKKHKTKHVNIVLTGRASVLIDGVLTEIKAPSTFVSEAGCRKVLLIHEEMKFITVHPLAGLEDCGQDVEKLVDALSYPNPPTPAELADVDELKRMLQIV